MAENATSKIRRPAGNVDVLRTDINALLSHDLSDIKTSLVALSASSDPVRDAEAKCAVLVAAESIARFTKSLLVFFERHGIDEDDAEEAPAIVGTAFQNDSLAIVEQLADEMMPAVGEAVARIAELAASSNPLGRIARRRRRRLDDAITVIDESCAAIHAYTKLHGLEMAQ